MNEDQQKPMEGLDQGTQSVVHILRYFFGALTVVMTLCIGYFFVSGFFIVHQGEEVLHFRFGKYMDTKAEQDWYAAAPRHIDRIERVPVAQRKILDSSFFWYTEDPRNVLSSSASLPQSPLAVGKDGYHLTADRNIIHSKWSVIYRISNAKDYYTQYAKPEDIIRFCLRNAVIKASAALPVDQILSDEKDQFRNAVKQTLIATTNDLRIGISILELSFVGKSVPQATRKSFDEITNAANEADTRKKQALGYLNQKREEAGADAQRIIQEAHTYKQSQVNSTRADADYISSIRDQYRESGASILLPSYVDALMEVVEKADHISVVYPNQEVRVSVEPRMDKKDVQNGDEEAK